MIYDMTGVQTEMLAVVIFVGIMECSWIFLLQRKGPVLTLVGKVLGKLGK
jgi:hypothetical protein